MNHLCRSSLYRTYGILSLLVFCQIHSVTIFPLCHICCLISFKIYQLQVWESKTDSGPALAESSLYGYSCAGTEASLLLENIHSRSGISLCWMLLINIDLKFIWICRELQKPRSKHRTRDPPHIQNRRSAQKQRDKILLPLTSSVLHLQGKPGRMFLPEPYFIMSTLQISLK